MTFKERLIPRVCSLFCLVLLGIALVGCSSSPSRHKKNPFAGVGSPIYPGNGPLPKGGGRYVVGKPYAVAGDMYYPREVSHYDHVGVASWYGPQFHRRMTSNGEWFDMDYVSAAHPTLPLPSYAKVTNMKTGRALVVRINDRGPFVANREIDLSRKSAQLLGYHGKGLTQVRVQYIGRAPLNDKGSHLAAMNAELHRGTSLSRMIASADMTQNSMHGQASVSQIAALETGGALRAAGTPGFSPPSSYLAQARPSFSRKPVALAAVSPPVLHRPQQVAGAPLPFKMAHSSPSPFRNVDAAMPASQQGGGYFIQVGAFSHSENVARLERSLSGVAPVVVSATSGQNGKIYRVQLGPLASATKAEVVLGQVVARGHHDAKVIVMASN